MQFLTRCILMWALVVHALVNGEYQDAILEVYDTEVQCNQVKDAQHIIGECYEVEAIANRASM